VKIGGHDLRDRVLVVAEIGNNHEGDVDVAAELVDRAAEAGVDAVKFQTFRTAHYVSRSEGERYRRLERFELGASDFERLAGRARSRGLLFISTPFDLESVKVLEPLVDAFKVASGDNCFFPLLESVARCPRPMIISSGLSDLDDIKRTWAFVASRRPDGAARQNVAILHCVSAYPVEPEQANLRAIQTLAAELGCDVGYSDHTRGIDAAVLAVGLGARIIEKHFTLSRTYSTFRDHDLSADPDEMRELVRRVRLATVLLGDGDKKIQPAEADGVESLRRSIVAAEDLPAGHILRPDDLTWVRPGGGLPPGDEHRLLGRALAHAVRFGERLQPSDVRG